MRSDPARRAWPLFAIGVLIGLGTLVPFVLQAYRDIRIAYFYRPATCQIISSRTYTTTTKGPRRNDVGTAWGHPEFTYQLQVDGKWYTAIGFDNMGGRTAHPGETADFLRGKSYPCWYDPWNPEQAVLRRGVYKPFYFGLLIPAAILLIAGSMLVRSLRPVPVVQAGKLDRGEALAVRLRPEITGKGAVGCVGAIALVWTAGVVLLVAYLAKTGRLLNGDAFTWLAFVLAAIDAFIIYKLVRIIGALGLPEPVVEIDREPLRAGDSARILIRQPGPAKFEAFRVSLLCEEQGQKGTRKLHSHQIVLRKGVDVDMHSDLTESATIEIPANAQPSLKELQTIVTWKIVVKREVKNADAEREFVFRVVEG